MLCICPKDSMQVVRTEKAASSLAMHILGGRVKPSSGQWLTSQGALRAVLLVPLQRGQGVPPALLHTSPPHSLGALSWAPRSCL
jgi:hypothetical protein